MKGEPDRIPWPYYDSAVGLQRPEVVRGRRVAPWYDHIPFGDWEWVTPELATGAAPLTKAEVTRLVKAGITHVVTLCDEAPLTMEQILCSDSRITHLLNAEPDNGRWKSVDWFKRTLDFALPVLLDFSGKVYVHCLMGSNRGPAHTYALLRVLGMSPRTAEDLVRRARPRARLMYLPDAEAAVQALL